MEIGELYRAELKLNGASVNMSKLEVGCVTGNKKNNNVYSTKK